jgi:hypothetical protein
VSHQEIIEKINVEMNELLMQTADTTGALVLDTASKSDRLLALDHLTLKLDRLAGWLKAARKYIR